MPKDSVVNRLLNEKETSEVLGVSPKTLQQWRWKKTGPPVVRIGTRACRYRLNDLIAYMEGLQVYTGEAVADGTWGRNSA